MAFSFIFIILVANQQIKAYWIAMKNHGHIELNWQDNVLYVKVIGPFNIEGAAEAARIYKQEIQNKVVSPFSVIEYLDENSLGSPEVMKNVSVMWKLLAEHNCSALALVYANVVQRMLSDKYLPSFGKAFDNLEDAEIWIKNNNKR